MGKTSFQNLKKLIDGIENKIAQLHNGNLSVNELDELVKQSADLHERLAVLRYMAYEKFGEPEISAKIQPEIKVDERVEKKEEETPLALDFSGITSTINENVEQEKPIEKEESHELDFSAPVFEKPVPETKPVQVKEPEVKKPIHVIREENKQEAVSLHEKFLKDDEVLNEKLKAPAEDVPLRKKLGLTPIADLKTEIGIGKKFEYINFLFAGDAKAYDTAINDLNNAGNAESAKQKLNVYASVYNWDLEEKTIVKFIELVERRYL